MQVKIHTNFQDEIRSKVTQAEVADIHYLQDIKTQVSDCNILGDKEYLSCDVQIDLFQTANIRLEVPKKKSKGLQTAILSV